jgi:23S rRNA (cytidine1920-2'-O)/16S rRNA (cytidine1409-2'-O)-methyltransferase
MTKTRLDVLLHERGLAESRSKAQALIMAGQVLVDGVPVTKAGTPVKPEAILSIKKTNPYVSRGGLKLEGALETLGTDVRDKVCMDVGASTGGFTDCLLQHGARKVYAVDVGHGQLHYKLRSDPRVINIEGVNFRYFSCESLKEKVEFVTIDVSFISLEKILPPVVGCLAEMGEILAMVKPQFEASPGETKKGVVRDETVRTRTIEKIKIFASTLGLHLNGELDSPVKGPEGNIEHFLWLIKDRGR